MTANIVALDDPLHPMSKDFCITLGGVSYGGEQLYKLVEAQQLGLGQMVLSELSRDQYRKKPDLLLKARLPRKFTYRLPRAWVLMRRSVRRSIFATAMDDIPGFDHALTQAAADTNFLFPDDTTTGDTHDYYDCWTTGASTETLREMGDKDYIGRNMLGKDLAMVKAGDGPLLDLEDMMHTNYCSGGDAPYGFMVIGDSTLKFLKSIESGVILARDGLCLRDISTWLINSHFSAKFNTVIVQCNLNDISGTPNMIEQAFDHFAMLLSDRPHGVYISAPLPNPDTPSSEFRCYRAQLCRLAGQYGFNWIDSDMFRVNKFRHPMYTVEPSLFDRDWATDKIHLNLAGTHQLIGLWEEFIPELREYEIGFRTHIHSNSFRPGHMSMFVLPTFYTRQGSVARGRLPAAPTPSLAIPVVHHTSPVLASSALLDISAMPASSALPDVTVALGVSDLPESSRLAQ